MRGLVIAIAVLAGCRGVAGSVAHGEVEILGPRCAGTSCSSELTYLGDGCYAVHGDTLYECTTDFAPVGALTCIEDGRGSTQVTVYVTDFVDGYPAGTRELTATGRCRSRFAQWEQATYPDRYETWCSALHLKLTSEPALAFDRVPATLAPNDVSRVELLRSGKSRVVATIDACIDPDGSVTPGDWIRSTQFAGIDVAVRAMVAALTGPTATDTRCGAVTIVLDGLECRVPQASV